MLELEDELQTPTGVSTIKTPKLALGGVLISTECGIMYEIMNTEGLRFGNFVSF
jgi:transmembrane E3 ubiquitin-protein ligase